MPSLSRIAAALVLVAAAASGSAAAAEPEARRVLIISSFGSRFAPFDTFVSTLRTEIAARTPGPVEFLEMPLEIARFPEPTEEQPFVAYLGSLLGRRKLDLVVTIGAPAADFVARHIEPLFPSVPILITALDRRRVQASFPSTPDRTAVAISIELTAVIENILHLLPKTRQIAVVVGDSPLERFWRAQAEREFQPFAGRVSFLWFDKLSLEEMRRRAAALPPDSAIFYGILSVDAAGVPHEEDQALASIGAAANAPIFGLYENQIGRGVVGGPVVSIAREARRSADVALEILAGRSAGEIAVPPPVPLLPIFDWRELHRWRIERSRLPPGSDVRFRPPSVWEAYRKTALATLGIVAVQAVLIGGLLAQRRRRRRAEDLARALNRRLLTAQEDERKALARELHDDLSQRLAGLAIEAAAIGPGPDGRGSYADSSIGPGLTQLAEDVHALAYQLHPSTLDDLGFAEALRVECDRFSRLESVPVRLDTSGAPAEPSGDVALCLFRVAQEGLRNVARHARASGVDLSCRATGDGVEMTIRDDGVGFDPDEDRQRPSLGLAGMRERVRLVGGRIHVRSAPGRGTAVAVWAPLANPHA